MSPDTPEHLIALASRLRQSGQVEGAIDAYQRLLALRPDLADSWFNLATMQRRAGRHQDALRSYQHALDQRVSGPEEVHLNRAVILIDDLANTEAAEAELKAALTLVPTYAPAWLNLGNLYEDQGDRGGAAVAYHRLLAIEPEHAVALSRVAGLSKAQSPDDPLIGRLRRAIALPGQLSADQAELGFALGRLLDQVKEYDAAFAVYAQANHASRASGPPGLIYDRKAHEAWIDRLISAFPEAISRSDTEADGPIFICGMFRSGSTLVEQVLASHDRVTAGGELPLLARLIARVPGYPDRFGDVGHDTIASWRGDYLAGLEAMRPGADIVTDKRPDNFLHIGLIKTLFPDARIVHTVRDPLDTCLSIHFLHLDHAMTYALDLEDTAHWYGQYRRLMAHWKSLYPDDIHDLDYDALVADPRPVIERLLRFCGLDWQESVMDFHKARNAVRTASVWQVREPLYRRSSGRAQNYARHLTRVRHLLGLDEGDLSAGSGSA